MDIQKPGYLFPWLLSHQVTQVVCVPLPKTVTPNKQPSLASSSFSLPLQIQGQKGPLINYLLNSAHVFVNSPFIKPPSNYPVLVYSLFSTNTLIDLGTKVLMLWVSKGLNPAFSVSGILFCFMWLRREACGISISRPGIEPMPSATKAWSPNHWTAKEFPVRCFSLLFVFQIAPYPR